MAFLQQWVYWLASIEPESLTVKHALLSAGLRAVLIIIPLLILGGFYPVLQFRRFYLAWGLAACAAFFFLPGSLLSPIATQGQYLLHITGLALLILLLLITVRILRKTTPESSSSQVSNRQPSAGISPASSRLILLSVLFACACYPLPWLAWGAQGSILDTLLGLALGISFSVAAIILLQKLLLPPVEKSLASGEWSMAYVFLGFASSTTLILLASSFTLPFGSLPLILMGIAFLVGWLYAGLSAYLVRRQPKQGPPISSRLNLSPGNSGWKLALLFSVAFSFPLVMFDPDELGLFLGLSIHEIVRYAFQSAAAGALVLLVSVFLGLASLVWSSQKKSFAPPSRRSVPSRYVVTAMILLALACNYLVYHQIGQPGFHGERLFVILNSQADLSSIDPQAPPIQRRQAVYDLLTGHAIASQEELQMELEAMGVHYTPYYLINALEIQADPWLRLWLSARPEVDRVLSSPRLRPLPVALTSASGAGSHQPPAQPPANLSQIGADRVWREFGITGAGVLVGGADSGVQADHPNLSGSYRGRNQSNDYSWLDPWYGEPAPTDPNGHGTHTLGIVLGKFTGVAPGANWIACANLPRNQANPALYLDCWQFLFAPYSQGSDPFSSGRPDLGAQVFNNSWGCPAVEGCDPQTFLPAVTNLRAAGVFLVVSAGNGGPGCSSLVDPPAQYRQVFSVGAVDESGSLAAFSSLGSLDDPLASWIKPDLVAPGVQILSSFPGNRYQAQSGTSMSGPHVAGVVALIWSANPGLVGDIETTEKILRESAAPYTGPLPDCPGASAVPSTATGYGLLDAYAAVKLALGAGD